MRYEPKFIIFLLVLFLNSVQGFGQDTLVVMTYNVLHYGDGCQGSNNFLHRNLKTIVQYENPDVLGLVKAQVIKQSENDFVGLSALGFADSIVTYALNAAYPNKYDHCPVVNFSNDPDGDMDLLFYNKSKLGFVSITNLCTVQEDFNLYKLYYKDPNLSMTKDSTFLYFILNHTVSGTSSGSRDRQDTLVIKSLKKKFAHLPNLISMGDFNTHSSLEPGYQLLIASADTSFTFYDPPYYPDHTLTYPSSWDSDASLFSDFLNTSTRQTTLPNSCGTANGAKGWYSHILLSPWIVKDKNYVKYVPDSYATIGNDGHRLGISINDSTTTKNTSAPTKVLNALFQLSDKYPIKVKLEITPNTSGKSLPDPILNSITETRSMANCFVSNNPMDHNLVFHFDETMVGNIARMDWFDSAGRSVDVEEFTVTGISMTKSVDVVPGIYILSVAVNGITYQSRIVKK